MAEPARQAPAPAAAGLLPLVVQGLGYAAGR